MLRILLMFLCFALSGCTISSPYVPPQRDFQADYQASIDEYMANHPDRTQFAEALKNNQIEVGMTKEECFIRFRHSKPESINTTTTANGIQEQYCWEDFGYYVYFVNNIVVAIQRSQ